MKLVFPERFSKNPQISNFMKLLTVAAELFHADGRTDMTKLTVAFRNFANATKDRYLISFNSCKFTTSRYSKSHTLLRQSNEFARTVPTHFPMWKRFSITELRITLFIISELRENCFREGRTFPAVVLLHFSLYRESKQCFCKIYLPRHGVHTIFNPLMFILYLYVKDRVFPVHVMKTNRGSKGKAPFILNLGTIRRWMCEIRNSVTADTRWMPGSGRQLYHDFFLSAKYMKGIQSVTRKKRLATFFLRRPHARTHTHTHTQSAGRT